MKDFKHSLTIKGTTPDEVFNALSNPFAIELWSGYPADFKLEAGAEFSMWEGDITGRLLEFVLNESLKQEWFFGDNSDPSVAEIKLHAQKNDTYITLRHTNIPDEDFENISEGWTDFYLGAIKKFFEED
jgi:activator of HSP90 ATPase